ncbi:hypothetical protein FQN54_004294 [Arachnomyces sp. PD_36]|nr:hypothetical protein FQN54_004294 [Arachnomyces sp. PD_36]
MISTAIRGRCAAFPFRQPATLIISPAAPRQLRTPKYVLPTLSSSFSTATRRPYKQLILASSRFSQLPTNPLTRTRLYSSSSSSAQASNSKRDKKYNNNNNTSLAATQAINPPSTTRPADLDLPTPKPTPDLASKFKYYISIGRAYLTFYKTGLKNVYYNYRSSLPLRRELGLPAYIPTSPEFTITGGEKTTKALARLPRSDFQLLCRSAYDVRRMVPFTFILLICGELTPFVVLALGNAICPLTCRVPRQLEKERGKRIRRLEVVRMGVGRVGIGGGSGRGAELEDLEMLMRFANPRKVGEMGDGDVVRAAAVFDLSPGFLPESVVGGPVLGGVYREKVRRWGEYLVVDDRLIFKGGGVERLSKEEVRIAVGERGGVGVGVGLEGEREVAAQREWLKRWIEGRLKKGLFAGAGGGGKKD